VGLTGGRPFLARLTLQGTLDWLCAYADGAPLGADQQAFGLALGPTGVIYTTGFEKGSTPGTVRPGQYDGVLTRHASDGSQFWRQWIGTSRLEQLAGVAVSASGTILTAGWSDGSLFSPSAGGMDLLIQAFTPAGATLWTRQLGGSGDDRPVAVAAMPDGGMVVVGHTSGPFAGLANAGREDAFIIRFNAQGVQLWAHSVATAGSDHAYGVLVQPDGDILVTGRLAGRDWTSTGGDSADAFVARYTADGDRRWLRRFGSDQYEYGRSLSLAANGDILVSGRSQGDLQGLANQGGFDGYLARFSPDGRHLGSQLYGTSGNDSVNQVLSLSDGSTMVAGMTEGDLLGISNERPGTYDLFIEQLELPNEAPWQPRLGQPRSDGLLFSPGSREPGVLKIWARAGSPQPSIQERSFAENETLLLSGLAADTRYGYSLTRSDGVTLNGGFRTMPAASSPMPFHLLALPGNPASLTPGLLDLIDQQDSQVLLTTDAGSLRQIGNMPVLERLAWVGADGEDSSQDLGLLTIRAVSEANVGGVVPGSPRWEATRAWIAQSRGQGRISILVVPASASLQFESLMVSDGVTAVVRAPISGLMDLTLRRFPVADAVGTLALLDLTPIANDGQRGSSQCIQINAQGDGRWADPATVNQQPPPGPELQLRQDSGQYNNDGITREPEVLVMGLQPGGRWQWSDDGGHHWSNGTGAAFTLSAMGKQRVLARQLDASGLLSPQSVELEVTLDREVPLQTAILTTITDNSGSIQGVITEGSVTDDITPTFTGVLSAPLDRGDVLTIFRNGLPAGKAQIDPATLGWSYTSSPLTSSGLYSFYVAVVDVAGNLGASSPARSLMLDTTAPTTTAAITSVTDDVGVLMGNVAAGGRSDDTTPRLAGSISSALQAGETLQIFNGTTLLGAATVDPATLTWSYTPTLPASPGTTYSFVARVADAAGNLGAASTARSFILDTSAPTATVAIVDIIDNVSLYTGSVSEGGLTNDKTPTLSGTLSALLAAGDTVSIFNGTTLLGSATVNSTTRTWSYTPTLPTTAGSSYSFIARVVDAARNYGPASAARSLMLDTTAPTTTAAITSVTDDVGVLMGNVAAGGRSDDTTPRLAGSISSALQAGETLQIFNGTTLLGAATVDPATLTWSYTPTLPASPGTTYSFVARVADAAGNLGAASTARSFILDTSAPTATVAITSIRDNTGNIQGAITPGATTNDVTPTLQGSLSTLLPSGETVKIYRDGNFVGNAIVDAAALTWSYTSSELTNNGGYSFTAAVADAVGNRGVASSPYSVRLDASNYDGTPFVFNWNNASPLNGIQGLLKATIQVDSPRDAEPALRVTALKVDLQAPGLSLISTKPIENWQANQSETLVQSTRDFLTSSRASGATVVAAVNTSFFAMDSTAQGSYVTNLFGLSISNGTLVSPAESPYPFFVMDSITGARIERDPSVMPDLARTQVAFAGMANGIVLWDGVARGTLEQSTDLNARTALGLSSDNRYLTLMTVNRSLRSITPTYWGASLYDVGVLLSGFGASKGLNLDGGGSALMASWDPVSGSAQLLNAPLFGAERNVGSNLGIAYSPPV
jgi:hypothetical protein